MVNVRIVAVALMAVAFVACTTPESSPPAELDSEPELARSGTTAKGAAVEGNAELEPEGPAIGPDEEALAGLPEAAPAAAPPPSTPSTSPLCGTGLTCSGTTVTGGRACRQEATSASDIYCCPNKGDRIVNGACVPLCGSGLTCAASQTSGATRCRQSTSSTSEVFCCPIKGWRIANGECLPPLCGTGLVCSSTALPGTSICRQSTTSTSSVYCCPSGQTVVNGKCQ